MNGAYIPGVQAVAQAALRMGLATHRGSRLVDAKGSSNDQLADDASSPVIRVSPTYLRKICHASWSELRAWNSQLRRACRRSRLPWRTQ